MQSEQSSFENPALQRSRGIAKLQKGAQQYVEQGYRPLIVYTLSAGGQLRKIGDNSTFYLLGSEVDKMMLKKLTRSMVEGGKQMKLIDSKDVNKSSTPRSEAASSTFFPLLPNSLGSTFWNKHWLNEVLTNVFKYLGYGQGGIPYGSGPLPRGYPEDFVIPWTEFSGPGAKPPAVCKDNYKEVLHQLLLSILEVHDIDGETHVCDPPLGKWVPKSQRSPGGRKVAKRKTKKAKRVEIEAPLEEETEEVENDVIEDPEFPEFLSVSKKCLILEEIAKLDNEGEQVGDPHSIDDMVDNRKQKKVTKGVIKSMLSEENIKSDIIVQIGDPKFLKDKYIAPLNDSQWFTERCCFSTNLSAFVKKNLESGDIIKIKKFSVSEKCLILEEIAKLGNEGETVGNPYSIDDMVDRKQKKEEQKTKNPTTPARTMSKK